MKDILFLFGTSHAFSNVIRIGHKRLMRLVGAMSVARADYNFWKPWIRGVHGPGRRNGSEFSNGPYQAAELEFVF